MGVDEALLKISFRIFGETFKDLRVYLSECVIKYLFSILFTLLNIVFDIFTYDVFHLCET